MAIFFVTKVEVIRLQVISRKTIKPTHAKPGVLKYSNALKG